MARPRTLKPEFFTDSDLAELEPLARLLFAGLWTEADREGRLKDEPKALRVKLLPFDEANVDKLLDALCDAGFIRRYAVDGRKYIDIPTWRLHQRPKKGEKDSHIPPYGQSTMVRASIAMSTKPEPLELLPSGAGESNPPRFRAVCDQLCEIFRSIRGVSYTFKGAKDGQAVKRMMAFSHITDDEIFARWRRALTLDRRVADIAQFESNWNSYAGAPDARRGSVRAEDVDREALKAVGEVQF